MQVHSSSTSIEQIARFIRGLDKREKKRLVQLVPELMTFQLQSDQTVSSEQSAILDFFDGFTESDSVSLPEDELFVEGLTFAEFFALPDEEQTVVWRNAHVSAENHLTTSQ